MPVNVSANLLPCDGEVRYHGPLFTTQEADALLDTLLAEIPWRNDETIIFGKRIVTSRQMAWFADAGLSYTYSGSKKEPEDWIPSLKELRRRIEAVSGARYNACLANRYHHGGEGMGWHSDNEASIVRDSAIASLSFGAPRRFCFRHRVTGDKAELVLEHGSLLVMAGETQRHWQHSLPKALRVKNERVNLTFRLMKA